MRRTFYAVELLGYIPRLTDLWSRRSNRCQHLRYMANLFFVWLLVLHGAIWDHSHSNRSNLRIWPLPQKKKEKKSALTFHKLSCISKTKHRMNWLFCSLSSTINITCILRLLVQFQNVIISIWHLAKMAAEKTPWDNI